jgi:fatty-acyl-CoA synthase
MHGLNQRAWRIHEVRMTAATAQQGVGIAHVIAEALRGRDQLVAFVQNEQRWTYGAVARQIYALARQLQTEGLVPGDGVAVLLKNRPESFIIQAASWMVGARVTALNTLASDADIAHILQDAEIRLLVCDDSTVERGAATVEIARRSADHERRPNLQLAALGDGRPHDLLRKAALQSDAPLRPLGDDAAIARLAYTGGTTGKPKGVILPHRCMLHQLSVMMGQYDWPQDLRMLLATPLSHAAGSLVFPTLLRGGTVHVMDKFDADAYVATVQREHITAAWLVPTMIGALLNRPGCHPGEMPSLQTAIYGAAPIAPAKLAEALERIGPVFMQHFGQTEAPNTISVLGKADHDPVRLPQRLASCGRPTSGIEVALLDRDGQAVADGADGELCVRGRLVMDGYWKRPEETAAALRGGWLHTGDVARRDADGYLYIVDRIKEMIISGGFNVYPREVEDALATHPAVAASAVVGVPDPVWGEAVKAFVVLRPGASADPQALIQHVRDNKGQVQAPKSVDFIAALPTTTVGKVDKKVLKQPYWDGVQRGVN